MTEIDAWRGAIDWIECEHAVYEGPKWKEERDDAKTPEQWSARVDNYLKRAEVLGLDTDVGRQAVAKAATTAVAYLESVFRVYGSVPSPGFTSGEIRGEFILKGGDE